MTVTSEQPPGNFIASLAYLAGLMNHAFLCCWKGQAKTIRKYEYVFWRKHLRPQLKSTTHQLCETNVITTR